MPLFCRHSGIWKLVYKGLTPNGNKPSYEERTCSCGTTQKRKIKK